MADLREILASGDMLRRVGDDLVGITPEALAALIESAGIPFPGTAGTSGQVLGITTVGPPLEVGWLDASATVESAIDAHNAETFVHGREMNNVLEVEDVGTNVQPYDAGVPTTVFYTEATAATEPRPEWDGPVHWYNTDGQTDPTNAILNDPIFKPVV